MAKKNLLNDIKVQPDRFYRFPGDVIRDRRFNDRERLEILKAWAEDPGDARSADIDNAIADIERRLAPDEGTADQKSLRPDN